MKILPFPVPPKWILPPSDTSIQPGQKVTLDCVADGRPLPKIQWFLEGQQSWTPIVSSRRFILHSNNSLTIDSSQEQLPSSIKLKCSASNGQGNEVTKTVLVSVTGRSSSSALRSNSSSLSVSEVKVAKSQVSRHPFDTFPSLLSSSPFQGSFLDFGSSSLHWV